MAQLPTGKSVNPFKKQIDGVFGVFKTQDSNAINYILTNFRIQELEDLMTATDAFDFRTIDFEELVQRDIDYGRVEKEIIRDYLEQDANQVRFFPPILVSLVSIDKGKILDSYSQVTDGIDEELNEYYKRWDNDKFELRLNISEKNTGHTFEYKGTEHYYYNYAATIKYNPELVKLVVIDGQHRFVALRRLIDMGKKEKISSVEVPACIFFTPDAVKNVGAKNAESIKRDLRSLFVTINTEAKTVSGHFIVLLQDKLLSAYCVRSLADFWKQSNTEPSEPSKLHLLEWNERLDRNAEKRQKNYSVTTVSILGNCLHEDVFCKNQGLTEILLNLSFVQPDLEKDPEWPKYGHICEDNFSFGQVPTLKKQIDKFITPALDVLFTKPHQYKDIWLQFTTAVKELDKLIEQHTPGAKQYKIDYLLKFRKCTDSDQLAVQDIDKDFNKRFDISDNDSIYFLNVFQQALIRAWATFCEIFVRDYEITPHVIADALVEALEKLCLNSDKGYFDSRKPFLQLVIFSGNKVILRETSKDLWVALIIASFYHHETRSAFVQQLVKLKPELKKQSKDVDNKLETIAKENIIDYFDALHEKIVADIHKNWKFKDYDKQTMTYLLSRDSAADDKKKGEFKQKVDELALDKYIEAKKVFSNLLGVKEETIFEKE